MRRLAVNVDVDSLHLYHAIHGLDVAGAGDAAWEVGVPRFLELFEARGLKATFFCVAEDLLRDGPRDVAAEAVRRGHELASHTYSHPYDLIHRDRTTIEAELAAAEPILGDLRGRPVAGFRAPGYNISDAVFELLEARGYRYDSSLFPCPPYYAARAAIIGLMKLRGRQSRSIVGHPAHALSSRLPHRRGNLLEYPMTVLPGVRFPLIGTSLTLLGAGGVRALSPVLKRMRFVNLEFHAIDLLDVSDLPDSPLSAHQPDLNRPLSSKRAAFEAALSACVGADNATLEDFATS